MIIWNNLWRPRSFGTVCDTQGCEGSPTVRHDAKQAKSLRQVDKADLEDREHVQLRSVVHETGEGNSVDTGVPFAGAASGIWGMAP